MPNSPRGSELRKVVLLAQTAFSAVNFRGPLIQELLSCGCSVEILAPDHTAETETALKKLGAHTTRLPLARTGLNPIEDLQTLVFLWRHFRTTQPDIVFSYAAKTNIWGMPAAALAGIPTRIAMVEGLGYAFTDGIDGQRSLNQRMLGALLAKLYRLAFQCAHKVIVLNSDDAGELQSLCGLKPRKTELLGGIGIPLADWPPHPPHLSPITFTLVARMLREKGVFEFIAAARRIKARHPGVRFYLLGGLDSNPGGISAAEIDAWVQEGVVEWPGQVNVQPWLAQSSVFVLPSYREGVPRSTQEAMAMARPVITTDVPGCRETVQDGVNGFMAPPRDVDALVDAMERFIQNPTLIGQMGKASRIIAEARFDMREVNRRLIRMLLDNAGN